MYKNQSRASGVNELFYVEYSGKTTLLESFKSNKGEVIKYDYIS